MSRARIFSRAPLLRKRARNIGTSVSDDLIRRARFEPGLQKPNLHYSLQKKQLSRGFYRLDRFGQLQAIDGQPSNESIICIGGVNYTKEMHHRSLLRAFHKLFTPRADIPHDQEPIVQASLTEARNRLVSFMPGGSECANEYWARLWNNKHGFCFQEPQGQDPLARGLFPDGSGLDAFPEEYLRAYDPLVERLLDPADVCVGGFSIANRLFSIARNEAGRNSDFAALFYGSVPDWSRQVVSGMANCSETNVFAYDDYATVRRESITRTITSDDVGDSVFTPFYHPNGWQEAIVIGHGVMPPTPSEKGGYHNLRGYIDTVERLRQEVRSRCPENHGLVALADVMTDRHRSILFPPYQEVIKDVLPPENTSSISSENHVKRVKERALGDKCNNEGCSIL